MWATSGLDLHLELSGSRVRVALEAALRDAVLAGRLLPGARLPSSRTLAADLGVARNTVADAYGQLVAEGWLTARQGSGTHVAYRPGPEDRSVPVPHLPSRSLRYDLRPGSPDLAAFPRSGWLTAVRRALSLAPPEALGYSDPRGRPELRQALAGYLARARGARVDPERIVICSGFTQGLWLLCQALRARGVCALAVEEYMQPASREVPRSCGLSLRPLRVDREGAMTGRLGGAHAALLTPAHQFPLGVSLSPRRRSEIVDWARRHEHLIIEDDYDGEFRYDRHPLGALQALAPERIVYAGTASKTLAPGLRLGWVVLPSSLLEEVVALKAAADRQCGAIEQLTLAEFVVSGAYDRHVRRSRLVYRRRRDHLIAEIQRHAPNVVVSGIAAGLHALIELPAAELEATVIARAAEAGLALDGLSSYAVGTGRGSGGLVVGYATPPAHAFTAAVARLSAVLGTL